MWEDESKDHSLTTEAVGDGLQETEQHFPHWDAMTDAFPELTQDLEAQILMVIASLERNNGKATTKAVATQIHLSQVQTWRYLKQMESQGSLRRVGKRGGWLRR